VQQFGGAHGIAGRAGYDGAAAMSGLWSPGGPLRLRRYSAAAKRGWTSPCPAGADGDPRTGRG
jgi:hypothetical protein